MSPRCIQEHPSGAALYQGFIPSALLADAPNGMSPDRPVTVFMPQKPDDVTKELPTLYLLAAWTAAGRTTFDWQPFRESLFHRLVRLVSTGAMPPVVVVAPDLFTDHGGSQYIDSTYFGAHGSHIVNEVIPWMETHFPVAKQPEKRAVLGKSSGGFGAVRLAMDFPGKFAAIACHSGDLGFEHVYRRSLVDLCSGLARYKGDVLAFRKSVDESVKISGFETHILMLLGMAGFYSPNVAAAAGYDLPIDWYSGMIDEAVWERWSAHDPVMMIDSRPVKEALTQLRYLFFDCGNKDQYFIHLGSRQFAQKLHKSGMAFDYQEFDDNHSNLSYRYDVSLPLLGQVLYGHSPKPMNGAWKDRNRFG